MSDWLDGRRWMGPSYERCRGRSRLPVRWINDPHRPVNDVWHLGWMDDGPAARCLRPWPSYRVSGSSLVATSDGLSTGGPYTGYFKLFLERVCDELFLEQVFDKLVSRYGGGPVLEQLVECVQCRSGLRRKPRSMPTANAEVSERADGERRDLGACRRRTPRSCADTTAACSGAACREPFRYHPSAIAVPIPGRRRAPTFF